MKICITCVYWTLLFISVASSTLLFIIVASESAQTSYYASTKGNKTLETYDNGTLDNAGVDLEKSSILIPEFHDPHINYEESYYEDTFTEEPSNFETTVNDETSRKENPYKNPDIVAESLTQQPNLSQGWRYDIYAAQQLGAVSRLISESDQASVLTLVDTTVAELQNLAEPKLTSEFSRTRLFPKNSSLSRKSTNIGQKTKNEQHEISPSTPSAPIIDDIDEEVNETNSLDEESLFLSNPVEDDTPEIVVVVRAEQSPIITEDTEYKLEDDVVKVLNDDIHNVEDTFTTAPELSDTEAKARLVGDNRDEAAAVVLGEGIVTVGSSNTHEDIPSFNEWTQKRLEEAEKKKTHPNASVQNSGTTTRGIGGMKVHSKNYASPDCGAKIVATNPEAQSARSVLASTRDEYMLNTCTSRIWFVVELCEAIQAKKIELANFELFSSSPKDFSVYISDRLSTRDWSPVGHFTAKDVKDIQSFVLQPHLFGKFIKIELQTYYGSEHFCPISLFRAYGTSEFEVLETETENQLTRETDTNVDDDEDSDEEEYLDLENGEPPRNLFGSARDAVLSIMKKAAEVLVKSSDLSGNNITKIQQSIDSGNILESSFLACTTPRYTILCDKCSDQKFARVFQLVSCRERQLNEYLKIDLVNRTLRQSGLCKIHGVGIESFTIAAEVERESEIIKYVGKYDELQFKEINDSTNNLQLTFITSILSSEYIAALCNVLATKERKVVMNTSHEILFNNKDPIKEGASYMDKVEYNSDTSKSFQHTFNANTPTTNGDTPTREFKKSAPHLSSEEFNRISSTSVEMLSSSASIAPEAFGTEEMKNDSTIPTLESSIEASVQADVLITTPVPLNIVQQPVLKTSEEPFISTTEVPLNTIDINEFTRDDVVSDVESLELVGIPTKTDKADRLDLEGKQGQAENLEHEIKLPHQDSLAFDNILSDLKDLEGEAGNLQNGVGTSASATQSTTNTTPQKESVFLRLSNRIKALERNMSLSGQYLEELSRRYKKQVEEMQRSLERTVSAMSEETKKRDERELKRAEEIAILKDEIASLSESMKNLLYDRNSWRGKIYTISQHILLICSEVFVIYIVFKYCRWSSNRRSNAGEARRLGKDAMRRKSAENFGSHMKKTKKRRPSEVASHITGTYRELMINDKSHEAKREKKKKHKKATALAGNQTNVHNGAERTSVAQCKTVENAAAHHYESMPEVDSSVEVSHAVGSRRRFYRRLKSAPEHTVDWFNDGVHKTECSTQLALPCDDNLEMESGKSSEVSSSCIENFNESYSFSASLFPEVIACTKPTASESSKDVLNSKNSSNILKDTRLRVTSSFMKTALSARKKRKAYTNDANEECNQNSGDSDDKTARVNFLSSKPSLEKFFIEGDATTNGLLLDQSDDSRSSSLTSVTKKKEKKSTGFKKMVRKFF